METRLENNFPKHFDVIFIHYPQTNFFGLITKRKSDIDSDNTNLHDWFLVKRNIFRMLFLIFSMCEKCAQNFNHDWKIHFFANKLITDNWSKYKICNNQEKQIQYFHEEIRNLDTWKHHNLLTYPNFCFVL